MMIKQIGYFEFMLEAAEAFPASAQFHASAAWKNGGVLFCAYDGDTVTGVCMLNPMGPNTLDVLYLYVSEACRRNGTASALLKYCTEYAKSQHKSICVRIIKENAFSDVFEKLAQKNNYVPDQSVHIYICNSNSNSRPTWMEFWNAKGRRICERLQKEGYQTKTFAEAPPEILEQLHDGIGTKFPPNLNPFSLMNRSDEWSFVTYKENHPVAFSAASLVGGKLIFEQLASAYDSRNTGVFLFPFACTMNGFFEKSMPRMNGIVYDANVNMKRLMDKFFIPFIDEVKHQVTLMHD